MFKFLSSTLLIFLSSAFILAQGCDTCIEADNITNGCKFCDATTLATGFSGRLPDCTPPCPPITDGTQPVVLCNNGPFVPHNMVWHSFVASSDNLDFTLEVFNCDFGGGLQMGIYDSCDFSNCVLFTGDCTIVGGEYSSSNFIPGQTYYMFLDGCNGDVCDYTVTINNLSTITLPEIDAITAYSICQDLVLTDRDGPGTPWNGSISGNCYATDSIFVCKGEEIEFNVIHAGDVDNVVDIHQDECNNYSEELDATFSWSTSWGLDISHNPYEDGGYLPPLVMPDIAGTYELCLDFIYFECDEKIEPVCINIIVEEDQGLVYYEDKDGDGYGSGLGIQFDCNVPDGYACQDGDCDDNDPTVNPTSLPPSINLQCEVVNETVIYSWDERPGFDYEVDLSVMPPNLDLITNATSLEVSGFNSPCQYSLLRINVTSPDNPDCNFRSEALPCRLSIAPSIEVKVDQTVFRECENHDIVELETFVDGLPNSPDGGWTFVLFGTSEGFTFGNPTTFDPNGLEPGNYSAEYIYTNPDDGCKTSVPFGFRITSCDEFDCTIPDNPAYPSICERALDLGLIVTSSNDICIEYCNNLSPSSGCGSNSVWFKIRTDANASRLTLFAEPLGNFDPLLRLFEGGCMDPNIIVDCNDDIELTSSVFGNTDYYLEVSSLNNAGEFLLCINTEYAQADCSSVEITASRPENLNLNSSGPFLPGEVVEFNCTINFVSDPIGTGNNCQWLQGIIPNIGQGWEIESDFWTQGPDGSEFFPRDVVTSNVNSTTLSLEPGHLGLPQLVYGSGGLSAGDLLPPGWWFISPTIAENCTNDGTPNTSWGLMQGCGSEITVDFSFLLKVKEEIDPIACLSDDYLKLDIFALADGMTGCWVSKTCGGDEPGRFSGTAECNPDAPDVFEKYPFLTGVVNPNDCDGTEIQVFDRGSYSFIYVMTADGGTLYFHDGTLYCTDSAGFSCLDAYGLDNPTTKWSCNDGGGGPGTQPDIAEDYPWINDHIDFSDCAGVSVELYQFGSQVFPYIITEESAILYSNTGQLYCTSALPSFDCIQIYGLSAPLDTWNCDVVIDLNPPLFEANPFLYDLLDPSDCEGIVTVYMSGSYTYFFIETNGMTTMYNSSGQRYCQDSPGFSCADAYGFTQDNIIDEWRCNGFKEELEERSSKIETVDLLLYPNPTNGQVTISGLSDNTEYPFEIYDYQGLKILAGLFSNEQQIDTANLPSGVYFFRTLVNGEIKAVKLIRL